MLPNRQLELAISSWSFQSRRSLPFLGCSLAIVTIGYNKLVLYWAMDGITVQIKTLLHHILYRHKVYRLQMHQLQEVLELLQQTPSQKPKQIQELIFQGIKKFSETHGDNISSVLCSERFRDISIQVKTLLHKVLHEYFFLRSIRAEQMFQSYFQNPGFHSMNQRAQNSPIFDDQFEKMKLHQSYYGSINAYTYNQIPRPPINNIAPNNLSPSFYPTFQPLLYHNEANQVQIQFQEFFDRPSLRYGQPANEDVYESNQKQIKRPPEVQSAYRQKPVRATTKKAKEKVRQESSPQQKHIKEDVMQNEEQEASKKQQFNQCICEGRVKNRKVYNCACGRTFHSICSQSQQICFYCKQRKLDPFTKVVGVIGEFIVRFDKVKKYERVLEMQLFGSVLQERKYTQIMVSSANPNFPGICWPDDLVFSINGMPIFQIPALLKTHSQVRRADSYLNITSYIKHIFSTHKNLKKISFSAEIKTFSYADQLLRRNNRKGQFLLSFFLVKQLSPYELMAQITDKFKRKKANLNVAAEVFEPAMQQGCQIQKLSVSLLDPYSRELIKCPVKGSKCRHLQCFDLKNFLIATHSMQQRRWQCPYCNKDVRDLVIDNYMQKILKQMKRNEISSNQVLIQSNGSYEYKGYESEENSGNSGQR